VRLLVFGSRTWEDRDAVNVVLSGFAELVMGFADADGLVIIEGGAPGADRFAGVWADARGLPDDLHERYAADWDRYGDAAGPVRNARMLAEGKPDRAVGFVDGLLPDGRPNSRGSRDMYDRLVKAGIPIYLVTRSKP
jgi:hypothetical protein